MLKSLVLNFNRKEIITRGRATRCKGRGVWMAAITWLKSGCGACGVKLSLAGMGILLMGDFSFLGICIV